MGTRLREMARCLNGVKRNLCLLPGAFQKDERIAGQLVGKMPQDRYRSAFGLKQQRILPIGGGWTMKFCEKCGAKLDDHAKFCSACGSPCKPPESQEKARFCKDCGAILKEGDLYCPKCGKPCDTSTMVRGRRDNAAKKPASNRANKKKLSGGNYLSLCILAVCTILWCTAPFAAVNLLTWGDQPTALQIVTGNLPYIGELTETVVFWAAIVSAAGIVVCFISASTAAGRVTKIAAILTEVPLGLVMLEYGIRADGVGEWLQAFGMGFWGISILLLVVACISRPAADGGQGVGTREDGVRQLGTGGRRNSGGSGGNVPSGPSRGTSASSGSPKKKTFKPVFGFLLAAMVLAALFIYINRSSLGTASETTAAAAPADADNQAEQTQENPETAESIGRASHPGFGALEPGQIITLGNYEQDGNLANGAEPVEWLVLENAGDTALVVSVLGLDTMPYREDSDTADWESSSVRAWLEDVFYENAFTDEEKTLIAQKTVIQHSNDGYPNCDQGADTLDHVFLLSTKEYVDLLYHNDAIDAEYREGVPSDYTLDKGAEIYDYYLGPRCWWWLRTTSAYNERACFVAPMGPQEVYVGYSVSRSGGMVRPAMWVMLAGGAASPSKGTEHVSGSGVLMPAEYSVSTDLEGGMGLSPSYTVFGSDINRELISSLQFLDTLSGAPSDAWDVSQTQDGSVLAWVKPHDGASSMYDLYIAGEGGVWAPEDCTYLLAYFRSMKSLDFNDCFYLENCRTMQGMFFRNDALEQLELPEHWDTSTVTNMSELFYFCSSVRELDVSVLDTRSVETMAYMFARCESLRTLDLRAFNTSQVTNMCNMFFQSWNLSDLDISSFDTSQVTNMDWMFYCCNLEELDLSSFDTTRVESAMLLWEAPPAALKTLTVGENFNLSLLRENAAPAEGGTINGQPWDDFLS